MASSHRIEIAEVVEWLGACESIAEANVRLKSILDATSSPLHADPGRKTLRGKSFYDNLISTILEGVRQAVSREYLIDSVIKLLKAEKGSDALGYIVLECDSDFDGTIRNFKVMSSAGFHSSRIHNFERQRSDKLADSNLLGAVIEDGEPIELLPTELTRGVLYNGEFDDLIDDHRRGAWICAMPLPNGVAGQPSRVLIALYPAMGQATQPAVPRGALQEWRVFTFLRVAYELLSHQLRSVADLVTLQRREILADLAPALVNHEINNQLTILDEALNILNVAIFDISRAKRTDQQAIELAEFGLVTSIAATERLHRIAHAFNNLDRRSPNQPVSPRHLLEEILTLVEPRFARAGIDVEISGACLDENLRTDSALFEHVLLNIILNAVDAIEQYPDADMAEYPRTPEIKIRTSKDHVGFEFLLMNNGPKVSFTNPERIFERGVTSKPLGVGHGLGLHVCRLIMSYLGGEILIAGPGQLDADMTVGFRVKVPLGGLNVTDVMDSATALSPRTSSQQQLRRS